MAQYLPLPDGSSVTIREGESPQEAYARAQRMYPEAFKSREAEKKETTVGGQAKEFFKGLAPGAINLVESAAVGASALLPEETEKAARSGIASLASSAKKPFEATAGYEDTVGRKFGEAAGSIIPFLGLGPLGVAGRVGMAALGSGAGAGEARTRAEAGGATEGERAGATALGSVVGISEMFAPARILGRVAEPIKAGAVAYVKRALMAGGEEAAQEAASQAAQNLISKGIYKPDQEIIEGVGESAAYGGAVGALAQGLFDMALGRRAKGAGKPQQQQEEFAKLRAEEEQRIEAERQRKATPEYAQEVVQKYDALAQQKQDLIAQIKKVTKDSPTYDADKAFNTQINAQIKTLSKEIEPLADDYYKSKAQVDALAKQAELDKLPPQDFMLQQMGMEVKPVKAKEEAAPVVRRGKGQLFGVEETPQVADTSLQEYAKGQYEAARNVGVFDMGDTADYMMQDPTKAAEMVKTRTKLPDLTAAENNLLLSGIKLRLADIEKKEKAATKQELAQRQETLKAQTLTQPEDQMAMFKESEAQVEEQKKNAEPNFDYLDPMFEKALEGQTVIAVDPSVKPIARGPQVRERIDALIAEADKADQDYRTARYAMPAQGKRGAPERAAAMEALTKGKTALEKIEQLSKEGGAYAREVIAARRAQQEAMAKLSDITEQLRTEQTLGGTNKEMAASTEQSLSNKAEQVRGQLISSALQEAALNRRAAGQPAITQDEAIKAASVMFDAVNDWVARSNAKPTQAEFEDVVVQPAQMRANKLVRPAVTERRQVKAGTQAISKAEITHFQERIKSAMRNLMEKPDVKATRVETGPLKRQFKETEAQKVAEARGETATTLKGELARRTEFVRNKMSKMGAMRPGARDALNAAADLMDKNQATREILDKVEPVVDAIVAGRDVKQVDIQAIKDAIRATETVPQGQKALFPEMQEELGYIRATPANFAKSPRMRPVWEALDKARALFKKSEQERLVRKATVAKRMQFLERVKERGDSIIADTQYFWKDTSRYSDEALAKVFVGMPEAGTTPEEKVILEKYRTLQPMSMQEQQIAERLVREFKTDHLPKYRGQIDEAMRLLADGRRLDDTDNQLLAFMQDTNVNVRAAAKALNDRLQPLRTAIKQIKKAMQGSVVISAEQKAMLDSEKGIKQQRDKYQQAVEKAVTNARREMDDAMAFLLDPVVSKASADLEKAKTTLDKEQAELDKIKKRFNDVLAQEGGANRTELATYELFRYEEKKGVIDDLKKQVEAQETELGDLVNERSTEHDGGYAVAQAMLDGNVKMERQYLEMLEANLATMRGESVLDKPGSYPFAYQQAKKNADAQRATLKAAEKRATEFKEQAKTETQKLEDFWKDKLGGEGIKREEGKVERIQTTAEKEADKLRKQAMEALDKEEVAAEREALKAQIIKTYADQMSDLLLEAEAIPGPNTEAELKKIINDPKSELDDVINAQAKVSVLRAIASVEAQEEVFLEGKPAKKQKAATTLSSVGQAKGKPLRTGRMSDAKLEKLFKPTAKVKALEDVYFGEADQGGIDINQYGEGKTQGSFDFGGDFNFSRGESTTGTDAKTLKAELDEAMGGDVTARGNVNIYNSVEEFLKENPDYRGEIPLDAKGFAEENRATLFANNIGKGHGLGVLLHEIGVHIGFRNFFNEAQFNRLANTVKGWAARTDNSLEAQIGRKAMQRVEMAETSDTQVDDELLAYAVEEAVQAGVMQTKKGPLFGWLNSIIDAFKKALNKLGIPTSEISAGDLVNFAYGCAQLELRGTWHGTGGVFDAFDFAFMGTGEGAQAYSWGTYRAQKYGIANTYRGAEAEKQFRRAMQDWENNPDVLAWKESQRPTYNGYTSKQLIEEGKNPKVPGKVGGMSIVYARPIAEALDNLQKRISDGTSFSPANTFEAYLKVAASKLNYFDKASFEDYIAENIDYAQLKSPYTDPLYEGKVWSDLYRFEKGSKEHTAGEVLWNAQQAREDTFEERLESAIESVREQHQKRANIFADSPKYIEQFTFSKNALDNLKKLDKNSFSFVPPTASPVPKPVTPAGVMMRTLHLEPEDTYLLWDASAEKQPAPVDKAVNKLFNDLSEEAQRKFLSILPALNFAKGKDIYNALAGTLESDRLASLTMYKYGISGNKFLDSMSRKDGITKDSTYNYVDFADKEQGAQIVATNIERVGKAKGVLLSRKPQFANADFERVSSTVTKTVAQDKTWWDSIKANLTGLAFETQLVDRFAGFERLAKYMEPLKGTQMLYYLRSYDQRMNIVSKAVSDGAPSIREIKRDDGRVERLVETTGGASIAGVVNKLKEANQYIGNGEAVNQVFTTYMAAIRAKNKGIETLNFGTDKDGKPVLTEAMLDEVTALVNKNKALKDIFEEARTEYNKYNRDLLDFVASTGALSKTLVKKLVAEDDYIPFYRERKGVVELVIGNENPIRIGSIADQPYLDKLVGGDTAIIDFMNSSVQNTNMLVDMGMRNLATKNAVMELVDLKAATLVKKADGSDVVKFKVDGDDRYAIVATEKVMIGNKEFETGVPADILVKGMEGIPTQMPFLFRVMAMPAQILRKAITLSPLYMAKQLFRDSLAAPILSGADFTPVLGALKEINGAAKEKLEKRGIVGGQYFRGTSEDLSMILREISDGQSGWMKALGRFEAMGMEADALTRRAQYNSYIEQGLSEMEATLMSLESMNFNKRGASPSVHVANALIPFFNAQIQGLNVMYKAMSGKMPFNDQLRIREKMLQRGGMMAAATFAYAVMMEDDEAYKNATPDQKYGNWFIRLPGLDEPVKVPVPFEIGYIFKAIPEALYNSMTTEHGGEEAVKAFKQILLQTIPGGSSYGIPQAAKPLIEVGLGKSFYTGRDILSAREKQLLPEEQYRVNTSDAAKLVGSTLGISPINIEALVSGYTGTMGLAFLQAISLGVPAKETPERAVRRLSEYPILGGAFQPNDAGGIINSVYERMNEVLQVKNTVNKLVEEGKVQEAEALITKRGTDYMQAELANTFKTNMNMLTQAERAVAASNMTPEAKRKQLDEIRKIKIALANTTREISDKTIRLIGGS
jgi:hypothetical protein